MESESVVESDKNFRFKLNLSIEMKSFQLEVKYELETFEPM